MKKLLEAQLAGSFNLLRGQIDSMTDGEWRSRAHPAANLLGFTTWHGLRTIDWAVCGVASGEGELADKSDWKDVKPPGSMFGAGVSREIADSIATTISRDRVREYEAALRERVLSWIGPLSDEDLERIVDLKAPHLAGADHLHPAAWEEVGDLDGLPLWQLLARPPVSHIRVHYGEVMAQLEILRSGMVSPVG